MLLCDAWFDIATATGTGDLVSSLLLAGLVELPLAVLATVLAHRARLAT
jgi:pyridoxal/pyridoxine/pyridoxamine kinase